MDKKLKKLVEFMAMDKDMLPIEAEKRIDDAFYNLYPKGGSVEGHEILEQAYQQLVYEDEHSEEKGPSSQAVNNPYQAPQRTPYEGYRINGYYGQTNKITIKADTLIDMEKALSDQLAGVRRLLDDPYSADSTKTTREVLKS